MLEQEVKRIAWSIRKWTSGSGRKPLFAVLGGSVLLNLVASAMGTLYRGYYHYALSLSLP